MSHTIQEVDALIDARSPVVRDIYERFIHAATALGPFEIEPKKTCIHLARDVAFAGIHPRADSILINLRTSSAIDSPRIRKVEQASKNRCHNELILESPDDVDDELLTWMAVAFALAHR